jgi:hypothetical protein
MASDLNRPDLDRIDQVVDALGEMLQRRAIAREIETLTRLTAEPEPIDHIVPAAINVGLCREGDRLAAAAPRLPLEA